jgi:hypothetical protein
MTTDIIMKDGKPITLEQAKLESEKAEKTKKVKEPKQKVKVGMQKYKLEITLTEQMLGTMPAPDAYDRFIASKAPEGTNTADEAATVQEVEERGWTKFRVDPSDGSLVIPNYMIIGFLKYQAECIQRNGTLDLKAAKRKMNDFVFCTPRWIHILDDKGNRLFKPDGVCDRVIRIAFTPGGGSERTALIRSDIVFAGRKMVCEIISTWPEVFDEDTLRKCLDRAVFQGLGQWRNASNGTFEYKLTAI